MALYKDLQNNIHELDNPKFEYLLPKGSVLITAAEADAIRLANKPVPTQAQIMDAYTKAVQAHLDAAAQAKGYDNIISASSYAGSPNVFQAESISFLNWRAAVWSYCYTLMAAVKAGTTPMPTEAQLIAGLPVRV